MGVVCGKGGGGEGKEFGGGAQRRVVRVASTEVAPTGAARVAAVRAAVKRVKAEV